MQLSVLFQVLRDLRDGRIDRVSMDLVHRLIYKHNFSTSAKEWKQLLSNAYVWYDWWSQPQPSMEKIGTPERTQSEQDLADALRSTAAFVERCDCMIILVPRLYGSECRDERGVKLSCAIVRGAEEHFVCWNFASYLSNDNLSLFLVRSAAEKPKWISAVEAQKLAVGMSIFSCEMNHPNGVECDKIASERPGESHTESSEVRSRYRCNY